ncbi:MAG TPA: hypothetical protein VD978_26195 [Azospirillum sp.]|nr:hypothetical protein [Azospirillum sp.]
MRTLNANIRNLERWADSLERGEMFALSGRYMSLPPVLHDRLERRGLTAIKWMRHYGTESTFLVVELTSKKEWQLYGALRGVIRELEALGTPLPAYVTKAVIDFRSRIGLLGE